MYRSTANNINFHYRSTSVKIIDQIFQQIQKILFLALFGSTFTIFGAKKFFPENPTPSHTTSCEFLAPCQNLDKINDAIPRKCLDRQKDRQTLFHRTLPATARGPIKVSVINKIKGKNIPITKFLLELLHKEN